MTDRLIRIPAPDHGDLNRSTQGDDMNAPTLTDWRDQPAVRDLLGRAEKLRAERGSADRALRAAESDVAAARARLDDLDVEILLGSARPSDRAAAETALATAEAMAADLGHRASVAARAITAVESSGASVLDPAKAAARAKFVAEYRRAIGELDRHLAAAEAANARVAAIFDAAERAFPSTERSPGGAVHPASAGLVLLSWPELDGRDGNPPKLETWRAEAREAGLL